ncbi:37S ribosomal protein S17 mitochondrial [Spathaspora sp. JA1]|nr:37S ribosomal protein S17 mitochondrial [Spathaspora sp. JA1]
MARQNFVGLVVSQGKNAKTVKVRVSGRVYDRKIDKEVIKRKDYLVHDEGDICKEGDIVRIESIPKRSSRKSFAIAEIKVNKGQKFAEYQEMARERVTQEVNLGIQQQKDKQIETSSILQKLDDLRKLDSLNKGAMHASSVAEKNELEKQIDDIKQKYPEINEWPSTNEILEIQINQVAKAADGSRINNIKYILDELMTVTKHAEFVKEVVSKRARRPFEEVEDGTKRNILRKYILNLENPCPVDLSQ